MDQFHSSIKMDQSHPSSTRTVGTAIIFSHSDIPMDSPSIVVFSNSSTPDHVLVLHNPTRTELDVMVSPSVDMWNLMCEVVDAEDPLDDIINSYLHLAPSLGSLHALRDMASRLKCMDTLLLKGKWVYTVFLQFE